MPRGGSPFRIHAGHGLMEASTLNGSSPDRHLDAEAGDGSHRFRRLHVLAGVGFLALCWVLIIGVVNPVGDFMINDDWSFVRIVEALDAEGRLIATGWGGGGPAAIVHVLWGWAFAGIFGLGMTVLRASVLVMAILGSFALFVLFQRAGGWLAGSLLATLTLVFNPLFLSQSFTYMTDITFTALLSVSLLLFHMAWERGSQAWLAAAMLVALAAVLTRQIGLVLPAGFVVMSAVIPKQRGHFGFRPVFLITTLCVAMPWIGYELFLATVGSTPVTAHPILRNLWEFVINEGVGSVLAYIATHRLPYAVLYTCLFISPVLALRGRDFWARPAWRYGVAGATVLLAGMEIALIFDVVNLPVRLHKNVIYDLGIGPILLKDTYVEGIPRNIQLPAWMYYALVYWAGVAVLSTLILVWDYVHRVVRCCRGITPACPRFTSLPALTAAVLYAGIILITGFHDRYLIPLCVLLTVWVMLDSPARDGQADSAKPALVAACLLIPLAIWSPLATHDFMATKRALQRGQDYVVYDLGQDRCSIDGGFEFNGYFCYDPAYKRRAGRSWWWVEQEAYALTLGPMEGYETVQTFPFTRYAGPDGMVHVLRPVQSQ